MVWTLMAERKEAASVGTKCKDSGGSMELSG